MVGVVASNLWQLESLNTDRYSINNALGFADLGSLVGRHIYDKTKKSVTDGIKIDEYATRVIVMNEGKVVYDGSKEELFSGKYNEFHLTKPTILRTIDYINQHTNYKIGYDNYNLSDLLKSLKDGDFNE
jgi:energy-coupling factor transport system ATP-binding protein